VDEVNLLDDHLVDLLLDTSASGINRVEREGLSEIHPSRFILIGTMNPEEGELRPQFLDRFGLCISVTGESEVKKRSQQPPPKKVALTLVNIIYDRIISGIIIPDSFFILIQ